MSNNNDISVGFVNLFILSAMFLVGFLGGAKFYQLTSSLEKLEKKSYQECIESLPRNKDCKVASIQFVIVEDK